MVTSSALLPKPYSLLLDVYYSGTINLLKMSSRGAMQCEAVLALRPSGKSLSTELLILLASWHVTLRKSVASRMSICLLSTCALALLLSALG